MYANKKIIRPDRLESFAKISADEKETYEKRSCVACRREGFQTWQSIALMQNICARLSIRAPEECRQDDNLNLIGNNLVSKFLGQRCKQGLSKNIARVDIRVEQHDNEI
jgi:hypothetical protein